MKYFIFATIPIRAAIAIGILVVYGIAVALAGENVGKPDWLAFRRWVVFAE